VASRTVRPETDSTAPANRRGALADELRIAVTRTARRLRTEGTLEAVTPSQYSVLAALKHSSSTLSALAERERVRPPSITRVVGALEERGLVERVVDPSDRRVVIVSLTDHGRSLIAEMRQRRTVWLSRQLADLEPGERQVLAQAAEILQRISAR
jgi:DNA-binding MarR family transcriptional regulator